MHIGASLGPVEKLSDETFKEWGIRARRLFERCMSSDITSANAICERMIMETNS